MTWLLHVIVNKMNSIHYCSSFLAISVCKSCSHCVNCGLQNNQDHIIQYGFLNHWPCGFKFSVKHFSTLIKQGIIEKLGPLFLLTLMKMLSYWLLHRGCWAVMDAVQGKAFARFSCGSCALCTGGHWSVYFMSPPLVFVVVDGSPRGLWVNLSRDWTRLQTVW